jgi:hypothetical protein
LICSNDGIGGKISVVLEHQTQLGLLTVCDEEFLARVRPDGVVGALKLLRTLHLLTVEKQNGVRVQRADQRLGAVKVLSLFYLEFGDTSG